MGARTRVFLAGLILLLAAPLLAGCPSTSSKSSPIQVGRPDSPGVAYLGADGRIWSLDTATGKSRPLLPAWTPRQKDNVVIKFWVAPDRTHIAFVVCTRRALSFDASPAELFVARLGGQVIWQKRMHAVMIDPDHDVGWSPDSKKFAYIGRPRNGRGPPGQVLKVLDIRTLRDKRLISAVPDYVEDFSWPIWLDSDRILMKTLSRVATLEGTEGLGERAKIVHLSGQVVDEHPGGYREFALAKYGRTGARLLLSHLRHYVFVNDSAAAWSPGHRSIAFVKNASGLRKTRRRTRLFYAKELWVVSPRDPRGHLLQKVQKTPVGDLKGEDFREPTWSRDGRVLFYWRLKPISSAIKWRMGFSGTNLLYLMSVRPGSSGEARKTLLRVAVHPDMAWSLATF